MTKKIQCYKPTIIFNGPPDSGKDEAAKYLVQEIQDRYQIRAQHIEFKTKLFRLVFEIFDISKEDFMELYNDRETKEQPSDRLYGKSPREAMIFVSETMIKPHFGEDYFGKAAAARLRTGFNIFSDGGFISETEPVYNKCNGDLLIVRIHRPGRDFNSDSRNYIQEFKDVEIVDIINDGTLKEFHREILSVFNEMFTEVTERNVV